MITATTNIKPLLGDIRKLRTALGKSAETQGRELAGSAGYIAARYSFPIERGREGGGGKLSTAPQKTQEAGVNAAISAYWLGAPTKGKRGETVSQLEQNHAGRVRQGKRIASARRIARFNDDRKARFTESNKATLTRRIQKRIGANKAAFVKAALLIHPLMRSRVPSYINRHVMSADGRAEFFKRGDGEYDFILTNYSEAAEAIFDRGGYGAAVYSASVGQIKRYESQIRKLIREAKLQ